MVKGNKHQQVWLQLLAVVATVFFLFPFVVMLINTFKTSIEFAANPFSLPTSLSFRNYTAAFQEMHFGSALFNSLLLTVTISITVSILGALAAYVVSRVKNRFVTVVFYMMIASMAAPFQAFMIPLVKIYSHLLGLRDSLVPVIYIATGLNLAFATFLVRGFLNSIPIELDQVAMIDGCGTLALFFRIIFPLLTPILITLLVFVAMAGWNDYLLSSLFLTTQAHRTLPMMLRVFCSEYSTDYAEMMAGLLMSVLPILIFYIFGQKYILEGVVQGSVKG